MNGIDVESPLKRKDNSDSDTDFQARDDESEGEETAEEVDEPVATNELKQPMQAQPSSSQLVQQGSPLRAKSTFMRRKSICIYLC